LLLIIGGISLILLIFLDGIMIYIILLLAGFGLSGPLVLTNVLIAQVTDEDEIKSGVRREAAFFGVMALISKPAQSLSLAIGPALLEFAGFLTPDVGGNIILNQPVSALLVIKALVGPIPGIAVLMGALILMWYPLKGDYLKEIKQRVIDTHTDKESKYKEMKTH
jgi:GPH family glycoside/pentoside/hexuronide:cation symporter